MSEISCFYDFSELIFNLNSEDFENSIKICGDFISGNFPEIRAIIFIFKIEKSSYIIRKKGGKLSFNEAQECQLISRNLFPDFNKQIDFKDNFKKNSSTPAFFIPVISENVSRGLAGVYFSKKLDEEKLEELSKLLIDLGTILFEKVCSYEKEKKYKNLENEYKHELETAFMLHKKIIPRDYFDYNQFKVKVIYKPFKIIGGDYYNFFKISDKKYMAVLADAAGKGLSGALISNMFHVILRYILLTEKVFDLQKIVSNINNFLCDSIDKFHFIATLFIFFDIEKDSAEICNCGLYSPVFIKDEKVFSPEKSNPPLGIDVINEFKIDNIKINNIRQFLLFTDGLMADPDNFKEIISFIKEYSYLSFDNIANLLYSKFYDIDCRDDLTIMAGKVILEK
ncbi:MAG: PP2C family protein-serine/threonine phosphatase [Candidatus Muiribacteriota bacterium]